MKTMAFRDVRANVHSEYRVAIVSGVSHLDWPDPPPRITAKWVKAVCERFGVDTFKVRTERRLYWHRSGEMGAHTGNWKREQIVGKWPHGGYGVLSTKIEEPGY